MKKLLLLLLASSALIFLGCSSDGSDKQTELNINPREAYPNNFLASGDSGNDILSNANFDRLQIEIAYVNGFRPTQAAMDNFEDFLREFSHKQVINISYTPLESPNETNLSLERISELEIENRSTYNKGSTLGIYIYFSDAPSDDDDPDSNLFTLGAVYRNTSMVIYESVIRELTLNSSISNAELETATLNHEFGHLFGLVNLGTNPVMINNHEDPASDNHCSIAGCLMGSELQFTTAKGMGAIGKLHNACTMSGAAFVKTLEANAASKNAIVPVLDNECRIDLENNGGRVTSTTAKNL